MSSRHTDAEAVYTGCHVYASVDPRNQADAGLRRFLHAMNGFPGYRVTVKERKPRGPYTCQHPGCRRPLLACPHCGRALQGTVEKGVDTALATDLIQGALDNLFDAAVLMSADADFVPAVELVQNRTGKRVIHAPPHRLPEAAARPVRHRLADAARRLRRRRRAVVCCRYRPGRCGAARRMMTHCPPAAGP